MELWNFQNKLGPGPRDDVTDVKDFSYQPEIWWDDAQYDIADGY